MIVCRRTRGLNNEHIATANVLLDFDVGLAVGNALIVAWPSGTPIYLQMRWASSRLAEPLNTFISGWSANIAGARLRAAWDCLQHCAVQFDKKRKAIVNIASVKHAMSVIASAARPELHRAHLLRQLPPLSALRRKGDRKEPDISKTGHPAPQWVQH